MNVCTVGKLLGISATLLFTFDLILGQNHMNAQNVRKSFGKICVLIFDFFSGTLTTIMIFPEM